MNRQGIEGIADHLKVSAHRQVEQGEYYLDVGNDVAKRIQRSVCPYAVVEPDNVYNVYDLADVKIPEGYEFAEFREPVEGDWIISNLNNLVHYQALRLIGKDTRRIIVKPVKKTRRVLVVEQEIPEDFKVDSVVAVEYDICSPDLTLNYFIEHREVKN